MRRQVKPFVTEYRGNTRRSRDLPKDLADTSDLRSRPTDGQHRGLAMEPPEDSYEAAMRAADALFAPAPRRRDPLPSDPEPTPARSAPTPSAAFAGTDEPDIARHDPPRRILQAIEPPGADPFAALEAERAPKRRGRKPGSKNKPKVAVSVDWSERSAPVVRAQHVTRPIEVIEESMAFPEDPEVFGGDESLPPPADAAMPTLRGRSERFGWKRSGLRPGERWKRRLPKVAW